MNTIHLQYAIEVDKTRSISQAADNLFMAQPNLSKAIKELEDTIGFPIFERTSKGVLPTQKGSEFLVYARNILIQLDKMDALSSPDNINIQKFSISIPRVSYIAHGLTKFVAELDMGNGIDVNVHETNSMQAISNIVEGRFNLGIIRYQSDNENYFLDYLADKQLCYNLIWEFEYLALMSKKHPLASVREIKYDELAEYTEIAHGDTMVPYLSPTEVKRQVESAAHIQKRIYLYERSNQFELLSNIPMTYMWVSPIPVTFLKRYDLVQRKCRFAVQKYKDQLIYPKGYKFSTLDQMFINRLYQAKHEVSFKEYH